MIIQPAIGFFLALSLGTMVSTSFLTVPIVFTVLERPQARIFTTTLWPRYFVLNAVFCWLAGGLLFYRGLPLDLSWPPVIAGLLMVLNLGAARMMKRMRSGDDSFEPTAKRRVLHQVTVCFNWICMALVAWSLGRYFVI